MRPAAASPRLPPRGGLLYNITLPTKGFFVKNLTLVVVGLGLVLLIVGAAARVWLRPPEAAFRYLGVQPNA